MATHPTWMDPFGIVLCLVVVWLPVYCALKTFQDFRTGHRSMALFGVFSTLLATALVALVIFARWGQDDVSAQGSIVYPASEVSSPRAK